MNAAFCCASLGIAPTVRHADYIGSWLEVLREDNRAIVRAASQASKAADWLLDLAAKMAMRNETAWPMEWHMHHSIEKARQRYAEELRFTAKLGSPAVIEAFATVARERFFGPGPW